ncbi:MAG: hypothetical protein LAN63_16100 [Acidobacteriia bacterium]|nr:hypothetical protein [Terriglobia bacterium]
MLKLEGPETMKVNRSQLRQNQSKIFRQARGRRIVQVTGWSDEDEKYVVDKRYFDDLLKKFHATVETLEITADPKLFAQILRAAETIDQDMRLGKLHSFEEAFGDE